jgi:membrane protease YdiL (CAAX protease family)
MNVAPLSLIRWVGQMMAVLALTLFWLIVAGYYAKLTPASGITYAAVVLIVFVIVQIALPLQLGWSIRPLLRRPTAIAMCLGALVSLIDFSAGALWLTAFGFAHGATTSGIAPAQIYVGVFLFPVIEEVAFRGWLQVTGERRLPPLGALLISVLLFAALHSSGDWLPRINAGLLLGTALLLTRSLWVTIGMHAVSNLLIVIASQASWLNDYMAAVAKAQPVWLEPSAFVANAAITVAALGTAIARGRDLGIKRVSGAPIVI